ncbi:hypothetical protein C8J56DRAFT_1139566 [Mycena floridula]|nr:hypothetical protein C8J56DRAFT_1139566 [Mycena floridula]
MWRKQIDAAIGANIDGFARVTDACQGYQLQPVHLSRHELSAAAPSTMRTLFARTSLHSSIMRISCIIKVNKLYRLSFARNAPSVREASMLAGILLSRLVSAAAYPSFFIDPATFSNYGSTNGQLNWNGGGPLGNFDVNSDTDNNYLNNLADTAPSSPLSRPLSSPIMDLPVLTRTGSTGVELSLPSPHRLMFDIAEIVTWSDYGIIPAISVLNALSKRTPHCLAHPDQILRCKLRLSILLQLAYSHFRLPSKPVPGLQQSTTRFTYGADLTAKNDVACCDSVPQPANANCADDNLYAMVFSMVSGTLQLTMGSSSSSTPIFPGITKVALPLSPGAPRAVLLDASGHVLIDGTAPWSFIHSPQVYNFNSYTSGFPSDRISPIG